MGNVNDILRNLRIHQQKYLVLSNILLIMNKIGGESPHQLGWTRVCRPAQYGFYAYIDRFDICKFIVCKKRNIVNKKRIKFWKFSRDFCKIIFGIKNVESINRSHIK